MYMSRIGEIVEATTTEYTAQCYDLYELPSLGSLVKTTDGEIDLFGIVYNAATASVEPGRRPFVRGKNEPNEEAVFNSNPQLKKLLRSEFSVIIVGYRQSEKLYYYLPSRPAHIHGFVYSCSVEEVKSFSASLEFLDIIFNTRLALPTEEVAGAALRQMSLAYEEPRRFLVNAGKHLAVILGDDFNRLRIVLGKLHND
jgi:hypothetical protein